MSRRRHAAGGRRRLVALALAAVALAIPQAIQGEEPQGLKKALAHRGLAGAQVGALVVDGASGVEVFSRHADRPMIAASNVKVLTALAALETFGPTHRFETTIRADRPPDLNGVVARLVVVGGGDPSLTSEQMWRLAADLARSGLRRVDGDVVLDAGVFDDQLWHPSWGATSSRAYHAPVAGLTVNYGSFTVEVSPGLGTGAAPRLTVDPPVPYFTVVNQARTVAGAGAKLAVDRVASEGGDRVGLTGSIGISAPTQQVFRSVSNPVEYAGHVLAQQLAANSIAVGGVRSGVATAQDVEVLRFSGKAMSEIVHLFMKYSNNNIAESMVKSMGQRANGGRGSWHTGVAAMRQTLIDLGIAGDGFSLVDGSGLSRDNRVSPRAFVTALATGARSFRYGPEFLAALPIANRDGTLERRASASRDAVRAKTGLLTGATALSGIARSRSGRQLLFSVIANGYENGDLEAMAALDAFAAALAEL